MEKSQRAAVRTTVPLRSKLTKFYGDCRKPEGKGGWGGAPSWDCLASTGFKVRRDVLAVPENHRCKERDCLGLRKEKRKST